MIKKKPKPKPTKRKNRAKVVKLDHRFWVRNASEIKKYRETELLFQENLCAISGVPLEGSNSVLDHSHMCGEGSQGRVRGVLLSEINCLEGKYLKAFKKFRLDEKYGLTFPQLLINMGTYLQQDNSEKPLHYKFMDDYRSHIKRLTKPVIISKLKNEFGLNVDDKMLHKDLVQLYTQTWIDKLELSLKEK